MAKATQLRQMLPGTAALDVRHVYFADAVLRSDGALQALSFERPDLAHLLIGEVRFVVRRAALRWGLRSESCINRVLHVSRFRHPFKIFSSIIDLVAVDVIGHLSGRWWTDERCSDKPVYRDGDFLPIDAHLRVRIAPVVDVRPQDAALSRRLPPYGGSNAAKAADFVDASKDWPPFLVRKIWCWLREPCAPSSSFVSPDGIRPHTAIVNHAVRLR